MEIGLFRDRWPARVPRRLTQEDEGTDTAGGCPLPPSVPAQEVDEPRRQQPLSRVPIGEGLVERRARLGHDLLIFGVRHQPVRRLAGGARMHRILPGTMQAGIVIERSSAGESPITGWSAPAWKPAASAPCGR